MCLLTEQRNNFKDIKIEEIQIVVEGERIRSEVGIVRKSNRKTEPLGLGK